MSFDLFSELNSQAGCDFDLPAIVEEPARERSRPSSSRDLSRLFDHPTEILFLDIETTGLSRYYDHVTLIGYAIGGEYGIALAGQDPEPFLDALARACSLITFNGSGFDLAFLEDMLGDVDWPRHHVDLRFACRTAGLSGGQKEIERILGIECRQGLDGVDGAAAVVLWHRYMRGDIPALRELIEYNRADVEAMGRILDHLVSRHASPDLFRRADELRELCRRSFRRTGFAREDSILPSPPVHLRPSVGFADLFVGTKAENATVVGLDLTGSAERPSGYCVLRGRDAETLTISDDDAIVEAVLAADPDLVSIDSPLCLPVGRTRVSDDDPRRTEAGIMRVSERILKRRGINVYPCLIPSMQKLTERGIALADRIRRRGVPVIECYPGAAQDIMGIPRKGAGHEWLQLGLSEFGVRGPFTDALPTHDELDAITCSLVGLFHIAGRTEALCGPGEEPMMVPTL